MGNAGNLDSASPLDYLPGPQVVAPPTGCWADHPLVVEHQKEFSWVDLLMVDPPADGDQQLAHFHHMVAPEITTTIATMQVLLPRTTTIEPTYKGFKNLITQIDQHHWEDPSALPVMHPHWDVPRPLITQPQPLFFRSLNPPNVASTPLPPTGLHMPHAGTEQQLESPYAMFISLAAGCQCKGMANHAISTKRWAEQGQDK
ncbi:hypothetical protein C0995_003916 [Termitomyces sp. Mi166|nr:hypothetical protein C0995_003916 [Termitomyces sp. Mi166\